MKNIKNIGNAGADAFVAGTSVFGSSDYAKTIAEMKALLNNI